jgi:hypothetical protein
MRVRRSPARVSAALRLPRVSVVAVLTDPLAPVRAVAPANVAVAAVAVVRLPLAVFIKCGSRKTTCTISRTEEW